MSLAYKESCLITWPWEEGDPAPALTRVSSHFLFPKFLGWSLRDGWAWTVPGDHPGRTTTTVLVSPSQSVWASAADLFSPSQLPTSKAPLRPRLSCLPRVCRLTAVFFGQQLPWFSSYFSVSSQFPLAASCSIPLSLPHVLNGAILPGSLALFFLFFFKDRHGL